MITNGHTNFEATLLIGLNQITILRAGSSVYIDVASLYWIGGILVVNHTRYLEATNVFKLDIVVCQGIATYIAGMVGGVKLMDTQYRAYKVCCTITAEGHTTDHIVTILVGKAIDRELLLGRHHLRDEHTTHYQRMVTIGYTIGLTIVVHTQHTVDALIHRPVGEQVLLGAREGAVVVGIHLLIGEHLVPYTHLVNIAQESTLTEGY